MFIKVVVVWLQCQMEKLFNYQNNFLSIKRESHNFISSNYPKISCPFRKLRPHHEIKVNWSVKWKGRMSQAEMRTEVVVLFLKKAILRVATRSSRDYERAIRWLVGIQATRSYRWWRPPTWGIDAIFEVDRWCADPGAPYKRSLLQRTSPPPPGKGRRGGWGRVK